MAVAVVGGGITGLAAAWELARRGVDAVVLEASARPGGKVLTTPFAGLPIDAGADAVLARVPWAFELFDELGLGAELVAPAARSAMVLARGRLRRLPDGLFLGVPADLVAVARSGILSPAGLARAGLDLVLPRRDPADSVGALVRSRFGREVADVLVDPLLGGINAGTIDDLSLAASAPQLAAVAARSRSLLLGARDRPAAPPGPVFLTHPLGLGHLVDTLTAALPAGTVRTASAVAEVAPRPTGPGAVVALADGSTLDVDGVVLATPAFRTADLLARSAPDTATALATLPYSSVAVVTLAVPRWGIGQLPDASGVLLPRVGGHLVTAVTWGSTKWAHWRPPGVVVLRASVGRRGDERHLVLDDDALLAAVVVELRAVLGLRADPVEVRLTRWPRSFPQYLPGHPGRVERWERSLARELPAARLAGAAYRGVGIPTCIAQGRAAAADLAGRLTGR